MYIFRPHSGATVRLIACLALPLALAGCQQNKQEEIPTVSLNEVKADLETLAGARVFFAHQSVGRNLLKGLEMLSQETSVALRIEEVKDGATPPEGPGLFHANVGDNGDPDSKIQSYLAHLDAAAAGPAGYDAAILKFCYVDADTDSKEPSPKRLFERYTQAVSTINERHPGTTVLHSTIPLKSDPPGWKTTVKRMIGKPTQNDENNIRRGQYNALLREHFKPAETFDLALLESTHLDGSMSSFTHNGQKVQTMAPEYTYDTGHLNDMGKKHLAAKFARSLAETLRQRPAAPPPPA